MTSVTEKPYCLVCSINEPQGVLAPRKVHICSKECKLQLYESLGIFDKTPEIVPERYKRNSASEKGIDILRKLFGSKDD